MPRQIDVLRFSPALLRTGHENAFMPAKGALPSSAAVLPPDIAHHDLPAAVACNGIL